MLEHAGLTSALLVHMETGQILYSMKRHVRIAPASMTKMMTVLLAFERIQAGTVKLSDYAQASENVKKLTGARLFIEVGERMTVEDLLKVVLIPSFNDAAFVLGEHLGGGSEEAFVEMMNAKAQELGMRNTRYINPHGYAKRYLHHTTAYDHFLLARALIRQKMVFQYSTLPTDTITRGDGSRVSIKATNRLLGVYPECDGLKTGFLYAYGSNFTGTMEYNGHRFVTLICEAPKYDDVFQHTATLFDYAKSLFNDAGEFVPPINIY